MRAILQQVHSQLLAAEQQEAVANQHAAAHLQVSSSTWTCTSCMRSPPPRPNPPPPLPSELFMSATSLVCAIQKVVCVVQRVQDLAEAEKSYLRQSIASLQDKLSVSEASQVRHDQVKQTLLPTGIWHVCVTVIVRWSSLVWMSVKQTSCSASTCVHSPLVHHASHKTFPS